MDSNNTFKLNTNSSALEFWTNIKQLSTIQIDGFKTEISPKDFLIITGQELFKNSVQYWNTQFKELKGDGIKGLAYLLFYSNKFDKDYFELVVKQFKNSQLNQKIDVILNDDMKYTIEDHIPCALNFYFLGNSSKNLEKSNSIENFNFLVQQKMDFTLLDENNLSILFPIVKDWVKYWTEHEREYVQSIDASSVVYNNTLEQTVDQLIGLKTEFNLYHQGHGYPLDAIAESNDINLYKRMWELLKKNNEIPYSGPLNYSTLGLQMKEELDWAWGAKPNDMYKVYSRMLVFLHQTKKEERSSLTSYQARLRVIDDMEKYKSKYECEFLNQEVNQKKLDNQANIDDQEITNNSKKIKLL